MPISHMLAESMYESYYETHEHPYDINQLSKALQQSYLFDFESSLDTEHYGEDTSQPESSHWENAGEENLMKRDENEDKYILIDTDEDAWATVMLLKATMDKNLRCHLVGVTTVHGNTSVDNVTNKVTEKLQRLTRNNKPRIPVFKGMASSLLGKISKETPSHEDHFNNGNQEREGNEHSDINAVQAIINFCKTYPGQLTIMCVGPLTNLAMALKLNPGISKDIKEIYILGGSVNATGNITSTSEFNFYADPEAAHILLNNHNLCPIYILPWETCMAYGTFPQEWRENLGRKIHTQEVLYLNSLEQKVLDGHHGTWLANDALLTACVINPKVVIAAEALYCSVELTGQQTRGMMVVDKMFLEQRESNALIIRKIDKTMYEKTLIWAVGGREKLE